MITKAHLESEIEKLVIEQAALRASHEMLVQDRTNREQLFQQKVAANQNRFQQLEGSIASLKALLLLNGDKPPEENTNT